MTTNPKTDRLPTEAELAEPDRRLDGLIAFLRRQNDAVEMARWFVENLADAFRLPLVVGHPDPQENLRALSSATSWALHVAGQNRGSRSIVVRAAVEHVQSIQDEVVSWMEGDLGKGPSQALRTQPRRSRQG